MLPTGSKSVEEPCPSCAEFLSLESKLGNYNETLYDYEKKKYVSIKTPLNFRIPFGWNILDLNTSQIQYGRNFLQLYETAYLRSKDTSGDDYWYLKNLHDRVVIGDSCVSLENKQRIKDKAILLIHIYLHNTRNL